MPRGVDSSHQEARISIIERDLGIPVKATVILLIFYYLFLSKWIGEAPASPGGFQVEVIRRFAESVVQSVFLAYVAINVAVSFVLLGMERFPPVAVQLGVFTLALADGLFLGGMVVITGGLISPLYWLYPLLVIRNSLNLAALVPQVLLNLLMCLFYAGAVLMDITIAEKDMVYLMTEGAQIRLADSEVVGGMAEAAKPLTLRLLLLLAISAWCYGLQVLLERQRRSADEARELALRREALEASGRLAAEIAHQLKNPLGIINSAAFALQRTVKEGKGTITQQIQIIREEVDRSDRLITELMGYAQLAEGRVEKLDVVEELDRAIAQVLPPAAKYEIQVHREYAPELPHLLAQRNHLSEVFVNILQNAREAMNGRGHIWVTVSYEDNYCVTASIADDGPGIAPEYLDRIFEPYFSTREKGSGLGLAIVKHNIEMYGGKVKVESELGKGSRFILQFPARTLMKLNK